MAHYREVRAVKEPEAGVLEMHEERHTSLLELQARCMQGKRGAESRVQGKQSRVYAACGWHIFRVVGNVYCTCTGTYTYIFPTTLHS